MSEKIERKFNRTAIDSQAQHENRMEKEFAKMKTAEIRVSVDHVLIFMDKIVEGLPDQQTNAIQTHIDNIYYHIGVIKGCVK